MKNKLTKKEIELLLKAVDALQEKYVDDYQDSENEDELEAFREKVGNVIYKLKQLKKG